MEKFSLSAFLKKASLNDRLSATHISLYAAIYSLWEQSQFSVWFKISRRQLMILSKLASTATYHKCLKDLVDLGYLKYEPSYNHYKGSQVKITGI